MDKFLKFCKKIFRLPRFGAFVSFSAVCFCILILWMVFEAERDYIFFMKDGESYNDCYSSVASIDRALSEWARAHGGKYPSKLSELVPKYMEKIPLCPESGKDEYSGSYRISPDGLEYFFCCQCGEHGGQKGNVPQGTSSPDYFLADDDRMPVKYECEGGKMPDMLKSNCEYRKAYAAGKFSEAGDAISKSVSEARTRKTSLYLDRAEALFRTGRYAEARDDLSRSLAYGFNLAGWLRIEKYLALTGDENLYLVKNVVRKYAFGSGSDNPEAVIFALSFCGSSMPAEEKAGLCSSLIESGALLGLPASAEIVLRGEIAEASGDSAAAEQYFLAVRDFVCGNGEFDMLVARTAEIKLGNKNFK